MDNPMALLDDPAQLSTPRALQWLARSKVMAVIWTTMRAHLEDLELARRRRVRRGLRPAPPPPPATCLDGTGHKRGHGSRCGGVMTCCLPLL